MSKAKKSIIDVQGTAITIIAEKIDDYICLTDIAKHKEPNRADIVIQNWMRNRNTVEFLGVWESLNNAGFKPLEFEGFKKRAGLNRMNLFQGIRLKRLNQIAIRQMKTLTATPVRSLPGGKEGA